MKKYRVIVDREKCIACGVAWITCGDVFEAGEDNGKNRVREEYEVEHSERVSVGIIPEDLYDCARSAAESCPVQAITVEPLEE